MFATAKAGVVLVTVNTNYKTAELEYLVRQADLTTLCLIDGWRDSDYVSLVYELIPELRHCERGHLNSERFPYLKNVVFIGQQKHRGCSTSASFCCWALMLTTACLMPRRKN